MWCHLGDLAVVEDVGFNVIVVVLVVGREQRAVLASDSREDVGDFYWDSVPQKSQISDIYSVMKGP